MDELKRRTQRLLKLSDEDGTISAAEDISELAADVSRQIALEKDKGSHPEDYTLVEKLLRDSASLVDSAWTIMLVAKYNKSSREKYCAILKTSLRVSQGAITFIEQQQRGL